jgi:hypothetical protein
MNLTNGHKGSEAQGYKGSVRMAPRFLDRLLLYALMRFFKIVSRPDKSPEKPDIESLNL